MDRGWCIGQEQIPRGTPTHNVPKPRITIINLTEMLRIHERSVEKKPVLIRPPGSRGSPPRAKEFHGGLSFEPAPKSIIRRRSRSLPSPSEKKKLSRNIGVRFVDSLGLDLEDVKIFKTGEDPFIPQHVALRLLMGAELADEAHLEISLPYFKPVFAQQPGDQPQYQSCLHWQKVCLERVLCFEMGIVGITQVLNLDFEKEVCVRYSFTEWKTCTETKASWVTTVTEPGDGESGQFSCDTFRFHLPVPPFLQPGAMLEFAIRYKVCGTEYWDNNGGQNYKLVCHNYKLTVPKECEDSMVHFI